jgi:hypothetical protein
MSHPERDDFSSCNRVDGSFMKAFICMIGLGLGLISCASHPDFIEARVIGSEHNLYAEWGTDEHCQRFERRFCGVRVKLAGARIRETAWLVRTWPEADRVPMPKVGQTIYIANLPTDSRALPVKDKSYWFRDVKVITGRPPESVNDSR